MQQKSTAISASVEVDKASVIAVLGGWRGSATRSVEKEVVSTKVQTRATRLEERGLEFKCC